MSPDTEPATVDRASSARAGSVYHEELDAERRGWYELIELVRVECVVRGYYRDPAWSVRDAIAHIGTWRAEAAAQLERLGAGTYAGHDVDVDGLNEEFLDAMRNQSWTTCWVQANAARTRMLEAWFEQPVASEDGAWWIRKSGAAHYEEHLGRLREWVADLRGRRDDEARSE